MCCALRRRAASCLRQSETVDMMGTSENTCTSLLVHSDKDEKSQRRDDGQKNQPSIFESVPRCLIFPALPEGPVLFIVFFVIVKKHQHGDTRGYLGQQLRIGRGFVSRKEEFGENDRKIY